MSVPCAVLPLLILLGSASRSSAQVRVFPGDSVRFLDASRPAAVHVAGVVRRADRDSLVLLSNGDVRVLAKPHVLDLEVWHEPIGASAWRTGAAIGGAIGGVIGGVIGWLVGPSVFPSNCGGGVAPTPSCDQNGVEARSRGAAVGAILGSVVGGLVGRSVPERSWRSATLEP